MKNATFKLLLLLLISVLSSVYVFAQNSDGVWEMEGYGRVIEMKGETLKIYDLNKMSCVASEKLKLFEVGKIITLSENEMTVLSGINRYKFNRLYALPELCGKNKSLKKDALYNFDSLWNTFDENYCYFTERNIDWDYYRENYRSQLNANSTDADLYKVLDEMLASMGDGHISLDVPKKVEKAYLKKYPPEKKDTGNVGFLKILELAKNIGEKYCTKPKVYNNGLVRWGMIDESVAYVQVNAMMAMADYGLPYEENFLKFWKAYGKKANKSKTQELDEVAGAKTIIEKILLDENIDNIILDLRFNPGGKDEVGLEIINHLTESGGEIFTKKTRLGEGFTEPFSYSLEPSSESFSGDVYALLSPRTASAAEIFSMASLAASNFTRIGESTEGVFSDTLDKTLPNGWSYTLSNEVYLSPSGENFENVGIGVDHSLNYPIESKALYDMLKEQLKTGDTAIEKAMALIAAKKP